MPPNTSSRQAAPIPRHRFPGDGLDYRRPANISTTQPGPANVVDLTGSDDEINNNNNNNNNNDDVQITSINTNSSRSSVSVQGRQHAALRPSNRGPRYAQPILDDDDDDTDEASNPYSSRRGDHANPYRHRTLPSLTLPPLPRLPAVASNTTLNFGRAAPRPEVIEIADDGDEDDPVRTQVIRNHRSGRSVLENVRQSHVSHAMAVYNAIRSHVPFVPLGENPIMDYTRAAFNIGFGPAATRNHARQPSTPAYEDLPPVADGFTRSPRDGDALICPFCERELCVGEGEARSQVWAVKACGHAYCGECAISRPKSSRSKKSAAGLHANGRKFINCVVPQCNEKVTGAKAMYQLFL